WRLGLAGGRLAAGSCLAGAGLVGGAGAALAGQRDGLGAGSGAGRLAAMPGATRYPGSLAGRALVSAPAAGSTFRPTAGQFPAGRVGCGSGAGGGGGNRQAYLVV